MRTYTYTEQELEESTNDVFKCVVDNLANIGKITESNSLDLLDNYRMLVREPSIFHRVFNRDENLRYFLVKKIGE